jgi:hypothetical protein
MPNLLYFEAKLTCCETVVPRPGFPNLNDCYCVQRISSICSEPVQVNKNNPIVTTSTEAAISTSIIEPSSPDSSNSNAVIITSTVCGAFLLGLFLVLLYLRYNKKTANPDKIEQRSSGGNLGNVPFLNAVWGINTQSSAQDSTIQNLPNKANTSSNTQPYLVTPSTFQNLPSKGVKVPSNSNDNQEKSRGSFARITSKYFELITSKNAMNTINFRDITGNKKNQNDTFSSSNPKQAYSNYYDSLIETNKQKKQESRDIRYNSETHTKPMDKVVVDVDGVDEQKALVVLSENSYKLRITNGSSEIHSPIDNIVVVMDIYDQQTLVARENGPLRITNGNEYNHCTTLPPTSPLPLIPITNVSSETHSPIDNIVVDVDHLCDQQGLVARENGPLRITNGNEYNHSTTLPPTCHLPLPPINGSEYGNILQSDTDGKNIKNADV